MFDDWQNDGMLWVASHNFGRLTKRMPAEALVYERWYLALLFSKVGDAPFGKRKILRTAIRAFPMGLRSASRSDQKLAASKLLADWIADPQRMAREVR